MMKKRFLMLTMVLLGLFAGGGSVKANEAWVYFMSLKAESSQESTGSGKVKLTWIDVQGVPFVGNTLAYQLNAAGGLPANVISPSQDPSGESVYADEAQLIGVTMYAMDGVELPIEIAGEGSQIYMTAYTYFHAENQPDDGSYFAGWTFVDPAITKQDTAMGGDLKDALGGLTGETTPKLSPCFKVLPSVDSKVWYDDNDMSSMYNVAQMAQNVVANPNVLYAIFNKYLLSNPQSTNGQVEAVEGEKTQLTVSVDVEGDVASFDVTNWTDFAAFSFTNNENNQWSYNLSDATSEVLSASRIRVTIPVTFTAKTGITPGTKTTTMTIAMAGSNNPSSLNVSLSVNALDNNRPYAVLYSGKTPTEQEGTLSEMITYVQNNDVENPIIKLNRNCTDAVSPTKSLTIDLNGNNLSGALTASGEGIVVTLAYSKQGGVVSGAVSAQNKGKLILNGGTINNNVTIASGASVEQNGAVITGSVTNHGSLLAKEGSIQGGLTSDGSLTIDGGSYNGTNAVEVSDGTAYINRGTLNGTECGLLVSGGTANVKKLAAITSEGDYSATCTTGTLNVESGKFGKPLNGTINFTAGYFKNTNYGVSTEGKAEMLISAGVEYDEGYHYFLGDAASGIANGVGVCRIGTTSYARLEDAIAYANNNPAEENVVIFMTNNYTLPAGYYTLPANATIVVPMSDTPAKEVNKIVPRVTFHDLDRSHPYVTPYEFRRLTFANGVNMDVFGAIEMTCTQFASNEAYTAQPYGPYGHLVMEEGSHITLQEGSELRAWGFMTGKGETDARRGSKVCEMFQMGDWKGAMTSVKITGMAPSDMIADDSDKKIFPVSQYFIQNVESPVKYHPGGVLAATATVAEGVGGFLAVSMSAADIKIVGVSGTDDAIFLMSAQADADNTWVRKWYDAENDIQVYDINSGAHIGSMVIDMGELYVPFLNFMMTVRLNSAAFDLPITNNMKIHLLTGDMDFKQNTCLLPGAEVEVDKEATVSVTKDNSDPDHTGALYIYDADQWGKYAFCNVAVEDGNGNWSETHAVAYTKVVRYAQSWDGINPEGRPTLRDEQTCPPDAKINVHGTFETATGFVYTSASGANIFSSNEDAGTFIFNENATDAGTRYVNQIKNLGETGIGGRNTHISATNTPFTAAQLKNGNGEYTETSSAAAGDAYCYQNDEWSTMTIDADDNCFMVKYNGNTDTYTYFAKPAEYIAVAATKVTYNEDTEDEYKAIEGNSDHTYSDAAGAGRLFILVDGCQWWEVEKKDNLYHCIHPENDTYYYWDENDNAWVEKQFRVTWKNWNGEIVKTANMDGNLVDYYYVDYGTMAEYLGSNPTREKTIDYTYDFTGWTPALGPVTSDVTYTATYTQKDRMYTIIFQNEGGVEIERQFLKHNDVPVCENTPTKVGHILQWSPAISPVIGDQIYTATWLEELPTEWDVTFVNNANGVLQATEAVGVNEHPTYSGSTPVKEAIDAEGNHVPYSSSEYTYTFWGWSAVIDGVAQQFADGAQLPCPNAPTTYTAVYTEAQRTYTVTFKNGEEKLFEKTDYHYGDMPACPANKIPADESDAQYTYAYAWSPQIQTVMGNQTYQWTSTRTTNKYTVTLTSNLSGVCTFTGAGTFDYGTNITNVAVSYNETKYTFDGWSDNETDAAHPSFTLTGDITLTANFTPNDLENHTIGTTDTWTVDEDTEVKDLIITSDGSACGQLQNPENLTIRGEAIFRQQQSFEAGTWYAVAVPWRVDPNTGIYGTSSRLASGSQIYIIEFDGAAYAEAGGTEDHPYWHFLHQTGADMVPGKLYMIYLASAQSKLDFYKKAGAALQTRNLTVSLASGSAGAQFANWNAISNPALYTADLSTGVTAYQYYNNNEDQNYTTVETTTKDLIVAKPIFVQVTTPGTVYATVPSGASLAPAYRRAPADDEASKFVVEISRNGKMADRLIVETADEKEDRYVIGQDLAKFGVSSKVAQMWINRYDAKLCVNTVAWDGEHAEYPLSIFAPSAGDYEISCQPSAFSDQSALYLTLNGEAIWNLSDGAYTLNLNKGTISNYGLRMSARAPQVITGVDEVIVDAQGETATKVLINNQVFIIRGDKVYTITGQLVK